MNTKIRVISTDVDGTLLNAERILPIENISAIKKLYEQGKHVVVNTGRAPKETAEFLEPHGIKCVKICLNGGIILDEDDQVIAKELISREDLASSISILEVKDIYFVVFTNKGNYLLPYFTQKEKYKKVVEELNRINPKFIGMCEERISNKRIFEVESFDGILNDDSIEFYKLVVFSDTPDFLDEIKAEFVEKTNLCVTSSWIDNLEINARNASKGNALKTYVETLGMTLENTMAIGDSYNDTSMLEVAGLSVAMGNAPDDIKEICDQVTASYDSNGWAKAVEKFAL